MWICLKGLLQREELKRILACHDVKTWLSAQELDVEDADLLFDLLDDGDGAIRATELTQGMSRLKGAAKSIDIHALMCMTTAIHAKVNELISLHDSSEARAYLVKGIQASGLTYKENISQSNEPTHIM